MHLSKNLESKSVQTVRPEDFWQFRRDIDFENNINGKTLIIGCGAGKYIFRYAGEKDLLGIDQVEYESWSHYPQLFKKMDYSRLDELTDKGFKNIIVELGALEQLGGLQELDQFIFALLRFGKDCKIVLKFHNGEITEGMRRSNLALASYRHLVFKHIFTFEDIDTAIKRAGFKRVSLKKCREINIWPLIQETTDLEILKRGAIKSLGSRFIGFLQKRRYYLHFEYTIQQL